MDDNEKPKETSSENAVIVEAPAIVVPPGAPIEDVATNLHGTVTTDNPMERRKEQPRAIIEDLRSETANERLNRVSQHTDMLARELTTAGQRRVNIIWEISQAFIAIMTVSTTLYVAARLALTAMAPALTEKQLSVTTSAFMLLGSLVSLVIGFYFGRTNHQKIGGVDQGR